MTAAPRARWFVVDGAEVTVGDYVALEFGPDAVGVIRGVSGQGLPEVTITEGSSGVGSTRVVFPGQILTKVSR